MTKNLLPLQIAHLSGPLKTLRSRPRLLVLDFDGTLSPLAARPDEARLSPVAGKALRVLRRQAGSTVAVLSGRSVESLGKLLPRDVLFVGNHGLRASVPGLGRPSAELAPYAAVVRAHLPFLLRLASRVPGALVEPKGCDVSLHYRLVEPQQVGALLASARRLFRGSGLRGRAGDKVLEFGPPLGQGKASGLRQLARQLAPGWRSQGACLFVGDDLTDEDAFRAARRMGPRMLAIKVGPGATAAPWRLAERGLVDGLLTALAEHGPSGTPWAERG